MAMVIIETPRLILRWFQRSDLEDLAALMADPEVMRYIGSGATATRQQASETLDRLLVNNDRSWSADLLQRLPQLRRAIERGAHFGPLATMHKPDNRFIGRCGLLAWDLDGRKEVEVGYILAGAYWGRGLATEAARAIRDYGFDVLGFDRLISLIQPANVASQRVAIKNAMSYECDVTVDGVRARVYGICRDKRPGRGAITHVA
jgi:ribosomal-protein-alanine N-acetyltransferase